MKRVSRVLLFTVLVTAGIALGGCTAETERSDREGRVSAALTEAPDACTHGLPQYRVNIRVAALEMVDDIGLQLGFPAAAITAPLVSMSVNFKRGRMALVSEVVTPLEKTLVKTAQGKADLLKFSVSAQVNLQSLSIEPKYFYGTPIAEVSNKALTDGIGRLGGATQSLPWRSEVRGRASGLLVLAAGAAQGVAVGDRFQIYHREFQWSGAPCASQFLGELRVPATPVAEVEVVQVPSQGNTAFARVLEGRLDEIQDGAEVVVKTLKSGGGNRQLRPQVALGEFEAEPLILPDGSSFDLRNAMSVLIRDTLAGSVFYLSP